MTNINYLVYDEKKKYVLRFAPKSNTVLGLNRQREIRNIKAAYYLGIGPKVIKFFPKYNLLVVEYLEGNVLSMTNAKKYTYIQPIARLLKRMHNGKKFNGKFNPFQVINEYVDTVKRKKSWLPKDIDNLLKELNVVERKIGKFYETYPCHLDLMLENIIINNERKIKLIDWEYSANSDFRFDLAMFSVKGNFSNKQDKFFLKEYGIKDKDLYNQIQMMKAVVYFREASWGLLQIAISPIKIDYKKYAVDNLNLFYNSLKEF